MTCDFCGSVEPERIIALYHAVNGTPNLSQLPAGFSFSSTIDAIVSYEEATGKLDDQANELADFRLCSP